MKCYMMRRWTLLVIQVMTDINRTCFDSFKKSATGKETTIDAPTKANQ